MITVFQKIFFSGDGDQRELLEARVFAQPTARIHQVMQEASARPVVPSSNPFYPPYQPLVGRTGVPLLGPIHLSGVRPPLPVRVIEMDEEPVDAVRFNQIDDEILADEGRLEDGGRGMAARDLGSAAGSIDRHGRGLPPRGRSKRPAPPPPNRHPMRTRSQREDNR